MTGISYLARRAPAHCEPCGRIRSVSNDSIDLEGLVGDRNLLDTTRVKGGLVDSVVGNHLKIRHKLARCLLVCCVCLGQWGRDPQGTWTVWRQSSFWGKLKAHFCDLDEGDGLIRGRAAENEDL